MDGDPVEGDPSSKFTTLTEVFIAMCPIYMEMGMSYHDYWHMNTSAHKAYRDAYELRRKNEEWARHRQGAYFMQALAVGLQGFSKDTSHRDTYPTEPWPISQRDAEQQQQAKEREGYAKALERRRAEIARRKEMEAMKDGRD